MTLRLTPCSMKSATKSVSSFSSALYSSPATHFYRRGAAHITASLHMITASLHHRRAAYNHGGNIWPNQPRPPSPVSMLVFGLCGPQQPALVPDDQAWWTGTS